MSAPNTDTGTPGSISIWSETAADISWKSKAALWREAGSDVNLFTFTENKIQYSLPVTHIVSVQSAAHYLEITDINGKTYRPRMKFSDAFDELSGNDCFLQLMRGSMVNMDHVTGFLNDSCSLSSGVSFPVSTKRSRELETIWKNYKFTKIREDAMRKTR